MFDNSYLLLHFSKEGNENIQAGNIVSRVHPKGGNLEEERSGGRDREIPKTGLVARFTDNKWTHAEVEWRPRNQKLLLRTLPRR